ncbi:nitrate reductase molybdenum cofactor assembly chaperone [Aurantimonas sp. VKM B-3413]|uniref:nitrate reductase molybdenum cofactor assembly chaperone n=1 Tax=Aurantimonas sp. VKM B-3413 TaxID=2779401 RepID=UPI001E37F35E|nr:nitrate reductase molybdenum cofactor assembly chaperone [Aurantimonas sp. VKM B-3413]MCB8836322.1 nitrate reductase molybdenum cofactor assembly chaperone [Aurantimonas sp. VKM B-3413]
MADTTFARTFKALSALLAYPSEDLQGAGGEIAAVVHSEGLVDPETRTALQRLLMELEAADLFELQEAYVELFDRTRRLSLHLFEHIHGESRDRGQAMVDLVAHYETGGLVLTANELPDYLPLFLEFLSTRPLDEARALLSETAHILELLEERLSKRGSSYAAVFAALRGIGGEAAAAADAPVDLEDEAGDLAALDAAWEETAVSFGPGDAMDGCSVDRLKTRLRAAKRAVTQSAA